jgi:phosphatidyl-myo-inositol dimannoside synthase
VVRHLLVTNDFPPKVGGIQAYLWELWRRLPADEVTVLTTPYEGAAEFDAAQDYRVVRTRERWLLPRPGLAARIDALADEVGAELVVMDPALPLGWVGPFLKHPYSVILHGAEVTVPGRLPVSKQALRRVLRGSRVVIGAGRYATAEGELAAKQSLPTIHVPPGVDTERFRPLSADERAAARRSFDVADDAQVVLAVSRLVPRKGFDIAIEAAARMKDSHPNLILLIGGSGRDDRRLRRRAADLDAPVRFLGRFDEADKARLYGMADVFTMLCRTRWGGLEQEGFGIVFVEAAAAGVAQVAGESGGAAEAVVDGDTGIVVADPTDVSEVVAAWTRLIDNNDERARMAAAARERAVAEFSYDHLAAILHAGLRDAVQ